MPLLLASYCTLSKMKNSASGPNTAVSARPVLARYFSPRLGDAARVAAVGLLGAGLGDGAGQREGRHGAERIDEGGGRVGHGQHVGGLDGLPAADRGAVEAEAFLEDLLGQLADRHS